MIWSPDAARLAFVSTGARPQDRHGARRRRRHRRRAHGVRGVGEDALRVAGRLAGALGHRTRSSGTRSATTGATCISTTSPRGRLKNQITTGPGPVTRIVRVDEKARTVYFTANGREPGQDPYFGHFYRVGLDGKGYTLAHARRRSPRRAGVPDRRVRDRRGVHAGTRARGGAARRGRRRRDAAREGRPHRARGRRLEAADAVHREGARRQDRPLRPDVPAHRLRRVEEVPDHQLRLPGPADAAAWGRARSPPRAATTRRSPSSASSWSRSTAWARRAARSRSTTPTTAPWAATTPCPTRSRA